MQLFRRPLSLLRAGAAAASNAASGCWVAAKYARAGRAAGTKLFPFAVNELIASFSEYGYMVFPFEPVSLTPTQRVSLTPTQYELAVKEILDGSGLPLEQFTSNHLDAVNGVDGSYVNKVTARFSAMGASFLDLIECQHEQRKVERQAMQVLHAKVMSTGAQKEMLFSVAGFSRVLSSTRECTASH
ncbi:hypothetical protein [Massilia consociata]|uniref:Uncharacterized protein n=1 Tax=Massilia consociata TaxID=760117 RepID=A0ABV6FEJ9_9BURK